MSLKSEFLLQIYVSIYNTSEVDYLDTMVKVDEDGEVYTTLYTKPTYTHTYLHSRSSHPINKKTSGPYSQLVRIKRICTKKEYYEKNSEMILNYYKLRGYPQSVLTSAKIRAAALNRDDLLSEDNVVIVNQRDENDLFLILTYNPANPDV